ncbi:hypothetical protein PR048_001867 [Dryococelus australis]|uniref:Uncharacterized protein n=1 Tax=Dryococelus australis TaxID=614101 RepID=A0ABQ9IIK4_9NEOP|nr:hypothetical protein PR048_001867 [Dryococelus australis]
MSEPQPVHIVVIKPEKIPTFSGQKHENIVEFFDQCQAVIEINGWNVKEKLVWIQFYLQGTANHVPQAIVHTPHNPTNEILNTETTKLKQVIASLTISQQQSQNETPQASGPYRDVQRGEPFVKYAQPPTRQFNARQYDLGACTNPT